MKKVLVLLVVLSLAVCSVALAEDAKVIGIAIYSMGADSCVAMVNDAQAAADALGYEIVLMDANGDPATQADQMASLIAMKVDAIILNPTDVTSLKPSIQAAIDAGITVAAGGMEMDKDCMDLIFFFAGVDDYDLASKGANWIAEKHAGKGAKIAILTGAAGTDPTNKTIKAFEDRVAGTDIEIVGNYDTDFDTATAMSKTEDILVQYPDIAAIFCQDHVIAAGASEAISDAGLSGKIDVVASVGVTDYLSYVKDGTLTCASYVLLYECGGFIVETLDAYWVNGVEPAAKYYADPIAVTAENLDAAYGAAFNFLPVA